MKMLLLLLIFNHELSIDIWLKHIFANDDPQ